MGNEGSADRNERRPCVARRAAKQWGCITTEQLRRCGVKPPAISRWVDGEHLHPLLRGVYAVGHRSAAPEQRWQAALLAYGDDAALSRHVSIALHGLGPAPSVTTVALPRRKARRQRGIEPHSSPPFERDEVVIR
jgi:hypothetical protein